MSTDSKTTAIFSRRSPEVDKTLAVRLIGDAWITFITKTLTTAETLGHPDIADELSRLEASGELTSLRSEYDRHTSQILSEILSSPARARILICRKADIRLLALALDRIQCTTFKFVEIGRPDREPPAHALQPLLDLFYQMLLDEPQAPKSLSFLNR